MMRTTKSAAAAWLTMATVMAGAMTGARAEGGVKPLSVHIDGLDPQGRFADAQAFCRPAVEGHVAAGADISPAVRWSRGPYGTRSFALLLQDADVPVDFSTANQEGKVIAVEAPRRTITHWVLVDIPVKVTSLQAGVEGDRLTPKGKPQIATDHGRRGLNDYGPFMASNLDMAGDYAGYDGPCPPWNDQRLHHYTLTVFALSVGHLPVEGKFDGGAVLEAIEPYILAKGSASATYSLNFTVK
ncbi:MAG TPA: YbhB/YbcL family Raf kinase inhibitor-like protein [Terriglobia bacterium]|nr:YbhB/YbcL family Raf kinase inhibitor-like protein [Terriglobia bacterium]